MRCLITILVTVSIGVFAGSTRAAQSPTAVVEAALKNSSIITAPASQLPPAVNACVQANESKAPAYVTAVLAGGRADADTIAPSVVASAIQGLPKPVSKVLISEIVEAAVQATPDAMLKIVRAAIGVSPADARFTIIRAAAATSPDPDALLDLNHVHVKKISDYKNFKDFKSLPDYQEFGDNSPGSAPDPELVDALNQGKQIGSVTPPVNISTFVLWPPDLPVVSR
jgi:hypothetical protein